VIYSKFSDMYNMYNFPVHPTFLPVSGERSEYLETLIPVRSNVLEQIVENVHVSKTKELMYLYMKTALNFLSLKNHIPPFFLVQNGVFYWRKTFNNQLKIKNF